MAIVNQIPTDTFENLAKGAGMLAKNFTPSAPATLEPTNILCATTGGVHITCAPTMVDHADGIDNAKTGLLEMQEVTMYEVGMEFTTVSITTDMLKMAMGKATVEGTNKVLPKHGTLTSTDVQDLWYIVPQTDKKVFAACIKNAFSTGGLDFQSENEGNGQLSVSLKGMYKTESQDVVPLECYVITSEE